MADANKVKKVVLALSVIALVSVLLLDNDIRGSDLVSVPVMSSKAFFKMQESGQEVEEDYGFDLLYNGTKLPYDITLSTYYLPQFLGSDWEEGTITATDGVDIFFEESLTNLDKEQIMAENTPVDFYALKGNSYRTYSLVVTGLPAMTIDDSNAVMEDGTVLFEMALYDPSETTDWVTKSYTTAAYRGNSSMEYPKKSFRLKLKEETKNGYKGCKENLLNLRKDDDWILNGLYADDSRMRDKLSLDLWEELGAYDNPYNLEFGTKMEYVELFVNDNYQGLYGLTYPVDVKQAGISAGNTGSGFQEYLYKKKYTAFWNATDFTGALADENMPDYRGGFQLKGANTEFSYEKFEPLRQLAVLMTLDDTDFAKNAESTIDIDNALNNWLFYQAIAGFDNVGKNYYYVAKIAGNRYHGYFIPWDLNISWGDVVTQNNEFYAETDTTTAENIVEWDPGQRLVDENVSNSVSLVKSKWTFWRNNELADEELEKRIDVLSSEINDSGAVLREQAKWPEGNCTGDAAVIKDYGKKRMEAVDEYINGLTE